ncbi:hypothetical protein ART_0330 [Arthrobacter sp. PAMC 25486]|uniref:hypothetical protein n=1 Tax=Arthrobacter sp. PAMC 25486 TaxID=1494608 RepID=UPI0005362187|nr:hypothetical protein [Arthrobacter sp. PAMC 25486]AIX99928.1 hypothetical protein ART_0330 [Arthrobacter sp. PAMC 25486]
MNDSTEPVEISTRMRPGEWTAESLEELVGSYQQKLREMGAPEQEIETVVQTPDDGSAKVHVSWQHAGVHTFANMGQGQSTAVEAENSRGHGENIPAGESTQDSQGLGAVLGDAERSAIDEPPTKRSADAGANTPQSDFRILTDEEGKTYVEDAGPAKE